ncbi:HK97-gp10 family putative phage morphogenesis protein [Vibrio sp. SCSIO 43136]|uniref:HK97-gp10 family putative phage morphogenesis protein n=1 Tax=Vibrio sp. SCSIO 43136 TaxID=2819101 RepID=UPI0020766057|nr:HK97-gp10 family putative phage morphogenesis protein [Vibrio sp. SCSIO 43136]USD68134.1 HK97 gp10 family phage protein [Vibrio sp. SCSIO 43136]
MITGVEVTGLKELEAKLVLIGDKAGVTALRRAGREAMKPVLEEMKANAGYDETNTSEPHLRDDIKISTRKQDKKARKINAITIRVGPSKSQSHKALWQEYGTSKQPPKPFMRPAIYGHKDEAIQVFKKRLSEEIEKAIKGMKK